MSHFIRGFCQFSYNNSQTCKKFQYPLQRGVITSLVWKVHFAFHSRSYQNIVTQKTKEGTKIS